MPDGSQGFRRTFRALRHRNYRLFFGGQLISLVGTWMQSIATTWLVYRMTNSAFLLGVVGFAGQIPTFLLSPVAGVLADRFNRRRIVIVTQTLAMVQAALLAALTLTGAIAVWHIIALSVMLGIINSFDMPTRQSFLVDMIEDHDDLGNAIALNSSMFNGARLVGPSIAGILIAAIGEGPCFLLNAVSYVAVIVALLMMKIAPGRRAGGAHPGVLAGFREGLSYAWNSKPIRYILLLISLVSIVGMPYALLMPIFARDILHGGPGTLGFLMGATGVGAVTGALSLASRKSVVGLGRWIPIASTIFGVGLIAFSFSRLLWLSIIVLFLVGFGMMVQLASSNTILQTVSDDDKRGRVMSFYTMSFMGMAPFGSLMAGAVASSLGAPATMLISGCAVLIGAALFARKLPAIRVILRPLYVEKGIIPAGPRGLQSATELTTPPQE